jgi:broad specificity phosphatase PhoE
VNAREQRARRLILVRHGHTEVSADTPSADWPLSAHGLARSRELGRRLGPVAAATIYSSTERKAVETARAIGEALQLPVATAEGLHEHDRRGTPLLEPRELETAMRRFFAAPSDCVFGRESAAAAASRFTRALDALTSTAAADDLVVVTHGTVMTLFLTGAGGIDPYSFWRALPMPCAALVRLPDLALDRIVTAE